MESIAEYIQSLNQHEPIDLSDSTDITRLKARFKKQNEDDMLVEKLANCLDNDGNIDHVFPQKDPRGITCFGTILHYSIAHGYDGVVEYALRRGANILIQITSVRDDEQSRCRNAVELAAWKYNLNKTFEARIIFGMLKARSLELYSSFGLTQLHLDCAILEHNWSAESIQYLKTAGGAAVNATISPDSPLWPASTAIHIAVKFFNKQAVITLLDLGADPVVLDLENKTPLHYLTRQDFYDERLFALDARDTLGAFNGETHFHIACRKYPAALRILKRYLDQGFSPDLPNNEGSVGLHIALVEDSIGLVELLIEYGADVNKEDSNGQIIMVKFIDTVHFCSFYKSKAMCLLLEAGLNPNKISKNWLLLNLSSISILRFLECITKLNKLNENLVSEEFMDVYFKEVKKFAGTHYWNETELYAGRCLKELGVFTNLGLRNVLDGSFVVKPDFKSKLQRLDSFPTSKYPIYGQMLKIRSKQKLLELEEKKKKMPHAVELFKSLCQLPDLCAENILWNLTVKELDQFV